MTTFGAAACQYFSSIGSLHAFTKTMNRFTAAAMRLKCTFHFKLVFSLLLNDPGRTGFVSVLPTGHHTRWFCERTAKVRVESGKWRTENGEFLGRGVKMNTINDRRGTKEMNIKA